jgi:hypothetical protein
MRFRITGAGALTIARYVQRGRIEHREQPAITGDSKQYGSSCLRDHRFETPSLSRKPAR